MQPSALQLIRIHFTKVAIEGNTVAAPEDPVMECDIETLQHKEVANSWRVLFTLRLGENQENSRFKGEVSLIGEFSTPNDLREESSLNLVNVNGPAVLFSSAREMIAMITGRFPGSPLILPTVSFIERKQSSPPNETKDHSTGGKQEVTL